MWKQSPETDPVIRGTIVKNTLRKYKSSIPGDINIYTKYNKSSWHCTHSPEGYYPSSEARDQPPCRATGTIWSQLEGQDGVTTDHDADLNQSVQVSLKIQYQFMFFFLKLSRHIIV